MQQVFRYHPSLVTLHWTLAMLIVAELCLGFFGLALMPGPDPREIGILLVHIPGSELILVLMAIPYVALPGDQCFLVGLAQLCRRRDTERMLWKIPNFAGINASTVHRQ
jgi:hypothetical protein